MKKHILITGNPRVGKTTLLKKLIENVESAGGFYTQEIRKGGERVGFEIITLDGKKGILARKGLKSSHTLGKYGINVEDLEEIGVRSLKDAIENKGIIVIDEIGKMELFSDEFRKIAIKALNSDKRVVGVIHRKSIPFLNEIKQRKDVEMYELTLENRNYLETKLKKELEKL
ncbi:MAG: NTPase [Acidobacteriota bacterium]